MFLPWRPDVIIASSVKTIFDDRLLTVFKVAYYLRAEMTQVTLRRKENNFSIW
jgi:hypothetical protein